MGFHESLLSELVHDQSRVRSTMVQMPAMNTPQFDWARSRLPRQAQPVPPIFQRAVGAEAEHHAVRHDVGREMLVGWSTVKAVVGERVVPRYIDQRLGRRGYSDEQTDEQVRVDRPDNLWDSVPGPFVAHGRFDDRARSYSVKMWMTKHKRWILLGGLALLGTFVARASRHRR